MSKKNVLDPSLYLDPLPNVIQVYSVPFFSSSIQVFMEMTNQQTDKQIVRGENMSSFAWI